MKKSLLFIPLISLFCFSCQKTEVQSPPGSASSAAVEGHLVGIGFYGGAHPFGDATIKYGSTTTNTTQTVPPGAQVQITALPEDGYMVDYWWAYDSQPSYDGSSPLPPRTKIQAGKTTFTQTITRETWFEPVFKRTPPIEVILQIDQADARGEIFFDYWDENAEHHSFSTRDGIPESIFVQHYSQIYITGYYKLNEPYRYYSYWASLNGSYIDMGMPYMQLGEFSFDHRATIDPRAGQVQTLSIVIEKQSYP